MWLHPGSFLEWSAFCEEIKNIMGGLVEVIQHCAVVTFDMYQIYLLDN